MSKDEALKMAIEALENIHNRLIATDRRGLRYDEAEALDACKEALERPAQEPYAWATEWEDGEWSISHSPNMGKQSIPLYPHSTPDSTPAIEQALKEKNHG
jgi:hypothetical protein